MENPMDAAMNATMGPRNLYGQVTVDAYFCILQKGAGKVLYDETQHSRDDRRTAIEITLSPIPEQDRGGRPIRKEMIAESNEWLKIVLPSLKALGIPSLAQLKDRFVKAQFVGTGRKYTDRNGEEREATTIKFLALYANMSDARRAYETEKGGATEQPAQQQPAAAADPNRDTALVFLKVLVAQSRGDKAALATQIAAMPQVNKYFTIDSPETIALLAEASKAA